MAKVFVVQETPFDFRPAEAYGEVVFMSADRHHDFHNIVNSEANELLLADLRRKLRDYDPEQDYLVPVGSPYVSAAVFWLLGHLGIRRVNILRWDNINRTYRPLTLQLRGE